MATEPGDAAHASRPAEAKAQKFDLAITLCLHAWQVLTVAVQSSWGGPDSSSKRDWFAGAVSDFFASTMPSFTDSGPSLQDSVGSAQLKELQEDLEVVLLQVMEDEFGVRVEDESEVEVAERIIRFWGVCAEGRFQEIDDMYRVWNEREQRRMHSRDGNNAVPVQVREIEEEGEWSEDGGEEEDSGEDVEMDEAPPELVTAKEKPKPEVDEEGFTKVTGRRKK